MLKHLKARLRGEQIRHHLAGSMPALNQRGMRAITHQRIGGALHIIKRINIAPRQQAGLGQIGRDNQRVIDQQRDQRIHRAVLQQLIARCRHHNRVNNHRQLRGQVTALLSHRLNHLARGQHAGLHHISANIAENRGHLSRHKSRGHSHNVLHAQRVLRGQGRDGRARISALLHDGFNIGLNTRAAATIGTGNNKHFTL